MSETAPAALSRTTTYLLSMASLVVIAAGVRAAGDIINPLLLALFVTALSAPLYFALIARRVPEVLALGLVILGVVLAGFGLTVLIGSSVTGFSQNIPEYQARLAVINLSATEFLAGFGVPIDPEAIKSAFDLGAVMGFVSNGLNTALATLTNAFFIVLLVIFCLLELSHLRQKILAIAVDGEEARQRVERVATSISRYFEIKLLMSIATAVCIASVLALAGIDYPILWGLLALLLNFIPNIGSMIAAIPAIIMALLQFGFVAAAWVGVLYIVVNSVMGNMIEPRLMGRSLGLSPLVVFVSLVLWGWLLGPVGMFLSVPLTITMKIILESSNETKKIALWLGD